jgi:hypothetical protein
LSPAPGSVTVVGTLGFRSKPLAALSIVLVLAGSLGGWHAPDDRDEHAARAMHQHADHNARFATPTQPTAPEHCVFCHWLRALGNGAPVATQLFAEVPVQLIGVGELDGFLRTTSQLALPSRAPPLV